MVVVRPANGLGNRLRALVSCRILAETLGREFALCWGPGPGWSTEDLAALFEYDPPRIPLAGFRALEVRALRLYHPMFIGPGTLTRAPPGHALDLEHIDDPARVPFITYHGGDSVANFFSREQRERLMPDFRRDYLRCMAALIPVAQIRTAVERLSSKCGPATIGVHIRRGDYSGANRAGASDGSFIKRMDEAIEAQPDIHFYLATDCERTERKFKRRYQAKIVSNTDKRFVRSRRHKEKHNQRDAVIDLIMLSRTQGVLGTPGSSFSAALAIPDVV